MPVPIPASDGLSDWNEILRRIGRNFFTKAATPMENFLLETTILAYKADYPQYAYRFDGKEGAAKRCRKLAQIIDDVYPPLHTATHAALVNFFNALNISRFTS
jgi:hypothetical protein